MIAWFFLLCLHGLAHAAPPEAWAGTWSLDASRSDDPVTKLQTAARGPLLNTSGARSMSPDGQATDVEAFRQETITAALGLLATSGQLTFGQPPSDEGLIITFAGEDPVHVTLTRKWSKVKTWNGLLRMRAQLGEQLVLERRMKSLWITETFLAPQDPETVVAVVRVSGSSISDFEFRRVYRALDPRPEG